MITIVILVVIIIVGIILVALAAEKKDGSLGASGFVLLLFSLGILLVYTNAIHDKLNEYEIQPKLDLPEEIYMSRPGDTLYINKRTKDSIYLGFRPIIEP